jgi:hypothetical protein
LLEAMRDAYGPWITSLVARELHTAHHVRIKNPPERGEKRWP